MKTFQGSAMLALCGFLTTATPARAQQFCPWSAPVNLGPIVNASTPDFGPFISKDGLSLYFTSNLVGSVPGPVSGNPSYDIWVSQRASVNDPWGPAQNVGTMINSANGEFYPSLSPDGHVMFFASSRPNAFPSVNTDIYFSRRHNKGDDFGWQTAVNLGDGVNTEFNEANPEVFEDEATGVITLYFDSNRPGGPGPFTDDTIHNGNDIYASILQPDGTFGPATLVAELSTPSIDRTVTIRRDGLEIFFSSDRPGGVGALDLWTSTRASTSDPWSEPVNLGPTVNSNLREAGPALSFDGTTLYFQSDRPGGLGLLDLYVATRQKVQGNEACESQ